MSSPPSILERMQSDLAFRLRSDSFFDDISIAQERTGFTAADLTEKLGVLNQSSGRAGLFVLVKMPAIDLAENTSAPGPPLLVRLRLEVRENRNLNSSSATGTGKSAENTILRILQALHHYEAGLDFGVIYRAADRAVTPLKPDRSTIGYAADFSAVISPENISQAPRPAITLTPQGGDNYLAEITSARQLATIYYSTDRSFPASSNPDATRYTAPFPVTAGQHLRAATYLTDSLGSHVAELTVPVT